MSSSSSSRSPSPAPTKGKGKAGSDAATNAWIPPAKYNAVKDVHDDEEWDWDAFQEDKDLELWLIRVPDGVKLRHLENVSIQIPSASTSSSKIGTLSRKRETYDIRNYADDPEDQYAGGEEIKNMSCLLPKRTKKGELRLAPRPISGRLVITSAQAKPTNPEEAVQPRNPERFSYSKDLLTHTFKPYGSESHPTKLPVDEMDVDEPLEPAPEPEKEKEKQKKRKKTSDDVVDGPKKAKKAKVTK